MQKNKDKVEEIPIEEFENDNQDFRKEFLEKFGKKEKKIKKSYTDYL